MTTLEPAFDGELADADDATIAAAVEHAEVLPLLTALAAALDDPGLVPEHLQPDYTNPMDPNAGLSDDAIAEARALARQGLARLRDEGRTEPRAPTDAELARSAGFMAAGEPVDHLLELLREELALAEDRRAPRWHKDDVAPGRTFRVAVIGAGMSGIAAAHRLLQAGIDVTVLEKDPEVGGTWYENRYPGCRVDVNNHFYSYSFAQRADWPEHFSSQPVLLEYFRGVADRCGVTPHVRFDTEVTSLELDEDTWTWTLHLRTPDGEEAIEAEAVVSGTGQLNRPNVPDLPGADDFAGPAFHSARWDPHLDLAGKRVAVIGTGASAIQFVPAIAPHVGQLTLFQRTPPWVLPKADRPVRRWEMALMRALPPLQYLWRGAIYCMMESRAYAFTRNVKLMARVAEMATRHLEQAIPDPVLRARLTPDYTPGCKRLLISNDYYPALNRPNVHVETAGIETVTATGIRTRDGVEHPVDAIIFGTGFKATDVLSPTEIVGRGGRSLNAEWDRGAAAYLGTVVAGYPNMFFLMGPNTGLGHNSMVYMIESQIRYVMDALRQLDRRRWRALDVAPAVQAAYNDALQGEIAHTVWQSGCKSWYLTEDGRNPTVWPGFTFSFRRRTRRVDLNDFDHVSSNPTVAGS